MRVTISCRYCIAFGMMLFFYFYVKMQLIDKFVLTIFIIVAYVSCICCRQVELLTYMLH